MLLAYQRSRECTVAMSWRLCNTIRLHCCNVMKALQHYTAALLQCHEGSATLYGCTIALLQCHEGSPTLYGCTVAMSWRLCNTIPLHCCNGAQRPFSLLSLSTMHCWLVDQGCIYIHHACNWFQRTKILNLLMCSTHLMIQLISYSLPRFYRLN